MTSKLSYILIGHNSVDFPISQKAREDGFVEFTERPHQAKCDGCNMKLYITGHFTSDSKDVVECLECGVKYFVCTVDT